jgi:hypothetical protein
MYEVGFDSNYFFPDDRLFAVVLNDIWVQEGATLLGASDRMAVRIPRHRCIARLGRHLLPCAN